MWNERPRSIRARLALRIVIGGGALLALLFSALDLLIDYQLYSRFDEALAARGRQMAADIGGGARIEHSAHHGWPEFRAGSHTDYYQLWDAAGVTVARSGSSAGQDLARPARPVNGEAVLYDVRLPDGHRGRAAAFQVSGGQLFVIASEREALDILESRIHVALAAGVGIALLLMVTLSHAAVRAGLRPLEAFGQRAAARARDPETPAAPETPLPDELRPIGAALDNAFAELTRALLRERRFARDLAHELRTPLAELFSLLETTRAADDASRSRLALAGSTLTGMSRIVDGLLALARYEAGIDAPVVEPVDIAAAARTQCLASEARARVRGITLDVRLDPERWVMTDSLLIERILANLLGNAIDHSPDGGRIEVSCCAREESVTLVISSAAPDLDATDVARLGERHFRPSRGAPGTAHAGLGLALCSALAGQLDIRLAFDLHEGDLPVQLEKLPSISIEESAALDLRVEQKLLAEVPEIAHVIARLGSDELGFDPMGLNQSDVFLQLKPKSEWREPDKAWLGERIREVLEQFPGVDYGFTQPIEMRVSEILTGSRGDVAVKVFGPDLATLGELAAGIEAALRQVPGNQDVFTLTDDGVQYLTTRIDRLAAGHAGLSVVDVQDELRARIEGRLAGTVLSEGRRTPLLVRGDATLRGDAAGLSRGSIAAGDGSTVPLAQIASVERVGGPVKVDRENGSRYSLVQANVAGRDLVGFVE